jgi:CRP-like cAMP-binding protein
LAQLGSILDPFALARKGIFDKIAVSATPPWVLAGDDQTLVQHSITRFRRGPIRHRRDQLIVCEGDPADYIFLVMDGIVRSCRTLQNGTRNILGFYLPGELFGWANQKHALSVEAATDAMILYHKRSVLLSVAERDSRMSNFLLAETTNELLRAQEHALLIGKSAKSRVATFLLDLSRRLGKTKYLELPMSHQDIADHLGLTIETVSRTITELERSQVIARLSPRTLVLLNRSSLLRMKS